MQDNVTATEGRRWLMWIHTCVKEKGGYFVYKLWHFNLSVTQQYSCWHVLNIWLLLIISCWIMLWNKAVLCLEVVIYKRLQIWRHNYVISRNEYVIFTFSESTIPWVYSLQFLFKSTHHSWRYERKCEWVFFSEHSVLSNTFHQWKCFVFVIICNQQLSGRAARCCGSPGRAPVLETCFREYKGLKNGVWALRI